MKEINKKEVDKSLVWIEKPSEEENACKVGYKVWSMYKDDFNLTISDIAKILLCERQWVVKNIKPNVKHIFLNAPFRFFLNIFGVENNVAFDKYNERIILKDYYYFSKKDFYRWLKDNTVITKQTISINIIDYCQNKKEFKRIHSLYREKFKKASEVDLYGLKKEYNKEVFKTLNDKGKELFLSQINVTKRNVKEIDVTDMYNLPHEFTSIKELKLELNRSLEIVYRNLYNYGALKYNINNSLIRYDKYYYKSKLNTEEGLIIKVPYELVMK